MAISVSEFVLNNFSLVCFASNGYLVARSIQSDGTKIKRQMQGDKLKNGITEEMCQMQ